MSAETKELPLANTSLKNPSLYGASKAKREEILKPKGHEAAEMVHDVGFQRALANWIIQRRSQWRESGEPEPQPSTI